MPQNKVIISPEMVGYFNKYRWELLAKMFKEAVIKAYDVPENDVAFTAIAALFTEGEGDIQVENACTAGKDEYDQGESFNPTEEQQKYLAKLIKSAFDAFLKEQKMPPMSLSVWSMPHYGGYFEMFEKEPR